MRNLAVRYLLSNAAIQALSHPPFLIFSLSVFLSQLAFNLMTVVLIFTIFNITTSNFSVSILVLTFLLPQILLSFLGGVVADLRDKKNIMVYGNILRAIALVVLFFNAKTVVIVYIISTLVSIVTQFYVPAEAPLIPFLVKKDNLTAANSVFGISFFGTVLISYVLAGPLITLLGRSNIFLLLSLLFGVAGALVYFIPVITGEKKRITLARKSYFVDLSKSVKTDFTESYTLLKKTGKVGGAFFLLMFSQVIILLLATMVPGYAKTILNIKTEDLSLILFAPAALGLIIGSICMTSILLHKNKTKLMNLGLFISGLSLCLFPLTSRIPVANISPDTFSEILRNNALLLAMVIALFAGFANALIFIPSQTIIQEIVPENFRSRIYGLLFATIGIFSLLPIIAVGGLADTIGVGSVMVGVGVFIVIIGVLRSGIFKIKFH